MTQNIFHGNPANPGANGTAVVFDDADVSSTEATNVSRVNLTVYANQAVAIVTQWSDTKTGDLRQVSSDAVNASTLTTKSIKRKPGRNRITITTTTAPTTWQVAVETTSSPVSDT